MSIYDSRSDLQKSIDQYVYVLQVACGEKNPIRRKAFEDDVAYALQAAQPYKERFEAVMRYDIFAVDELCERAVEKINDAFETLYRIGAAEAQNIEYPGLVLAECAMTLVDTLRSLNAFDAEAVEVLIDELFQTFDSGSVKKVMDRRLKIFIHRYVTDKIPDSVLDSIAMDEKILHDYLRTL